jgi:hypothetical protein
MPKTHYLSYLLRLWRVQEKGIDTWRASLHSPQTGQRVSFRSLEALLAFLRRETGTAVDSDGDSDVAAG